MAVCGGRATTEVTGFATRLRCLNRRDPVFVTAGDRNIYCFKFYFENYMNFSFRKLPSMVHQL